MKTFMTAAGLAVGVSAAVLPRQDQCCFSLTASGGQSGQVGQLDDGQNRISGGNPAGTYCLSDGTITDGNGRGCILTPPTTQFQCDQGATPDSGFSVSDSGELQYNGDSTFYACAADEGEYNIYTSTSDAQTKCSEITLSTGGECVGSGNGASSSAPAASQPASSAASSASGYSAPASSPAGTQSTAPATTGASAPGYSAPGYSAPAYSAPAYSAPAYSAPAYSAPANSAPAYSAPAQSAPCPSATTVTVYSTVYDCQSGSAPAGTPSSVYQMPSSAPGYSAPYQSVPAPAPSSYYKPAASQPAPVASQSSPAGYASSAPSYTAPSGSATGTQPATSAGTASACQTSLVPGSYETPHLIVPVSSDSPDESYGTSYNAYVNGDNSTVFNFDIPASDAGKTCTLVFLFPKKEDLETTDYTFNGKGSLDFAMLSGAVDESTTYNSCPSKEQELGSVTPVPGESYVVSSGACAAGMTETIEMSASGGLEMEFFEDWNPSPLGLFITVC